ncbi:MAG: hypothetical protein ACRETM_02650 [Stenotrophobium sp.]
MIADCGPCAQLMVKMAEQACVKVEVLRGMIGGDLALTGDAAA